MDLESKHVEVVERNERAGERALLLGLVWNAWCVIDAYRHEAGDRTTTHPC